MANLTREEAIQKYGTEAATGWGEVEAAANFKPVAAGAVSPGLGVNTGQPAAIDPQAIYNQFYNSPEMKNTQTEIDTIQKDLADKKAKAAAAELTINDNPYYAESTRGGKINRQRTVAQTDQKLLVDQIAVLQNKLATLKGDAETQTNLALKSYDIKSTAYQNNLTNLNNLLKSGALDSATPQDLATISASTGLTSSMIAGMLAETKAGRISPQVISSTNDAGNVTISVVDQRTGKIISQNSLGKVDKATKPSQTDDVKTNAANVTQFLELSKNNWGHVSPAQWRDAKSAFIADKLGTAEDFIKEYARYADPNRGDFNTAYGFDVNTRYKLVGSD